MTSFVTLKKTKKKKTIASQDFQTLNDQLRFSPQMGPAAPFTHYELCLRRPADHLMWFPPPEQEQRNVNSFSRSLRKDNASVLTNTHDSAGCQVKKPHHRFIPFKKKMKQNNSNIELLLHTQATLCLPLQEQKVTDVHVSHVKLFLRS